MDAHIDGASRSSQYEGSVTLVGSSGGSVCSGSIGDRMTGTTMSDGRDSTRMLAKASVSTGVRQRITVVCSECKRLKLKCDRRAPCSSCLKRDTVPRCIYSQAATEKIDVQSIHNRLLVVEERIGNGPVAALTTSSSVGANTGVTASSAMGRMALHADGPRTLLAIGAHGASVAVSLDGAAGLWVDHLGARVPAPVGRAVCGGPSSDGVELRPFPRIPEAGVIDFMSEYAKLFRQSPLSDDDGFYSDDEDGHYNIGVTPQLVLTLPPAHIRAQIYPRYEAAHVLFPVVSFNIFRRRIEDMCRWAERASGVFTGASAGTTSEEGFDDPIPTEPPTLSFFAAAVAALALGAQCWLAERDIGNCSDQSSSAGSTATPASTVDGGEAGASPPGSCPGPSGRSMPPPPAPTYPSTPGTPPLPITNADPQELYRVSKMALNFNNERAGYDALDLDYIHSRVLHGRFLLVAHHGLGDGGVLFSRMRNVRQKKATPRRGRGKGRTGGDDTTSASSSAPDSSNSETGGPPKNGGKPKGKERGPTLALSPELVGIVSELIGNARMMGLGHDPDTVEGGNRLSLYEKEVRRRMWWEVVSLDAVAADCIGQPPLLNASDYSTQLPTDVDDEMFGPDSANLPAPNIETMQGNIDYFIQRVRLMQLTQSLKKRLDILRETKSEDDSQGARSKLPVVLQEYHLFLSELPEFLKLDHVPSPREVLTLKKSGSVSPSLRSPPTALSEARSPTCGADEPPISLVPNSPFVMALRCDLAISARYSFLKLCLPFMKGTAAPSNPEVLDSRTPEDLSMLIMLEPAMAIIRTWNYLHSFFKNIRPSMFQCYYFTRNLFDAGVVLSHMAIKWPLYTASALDSVQTAADVLRDPTVLTGRPAPGNVDSTPSEAVRIILELLQLAESAKFGPSPASSGVKRKHEEVDTSASDFLYNFRFPYVGTGVVSAGPPPPAPPAPATVAMPVADCGSGASRTSQKSGDSTTQGRSRAKRSPVDKGTASGDPTPAMIKQKASHSGVSVRQRPKASKSKEPTRARAESTTSTSHATQPAAAAPPAPAVPAPQPPQGSISFMQHHPSPDPPQVQPQYHLASNPAPSAQSQPYAAHQANSAAGGYHSGYESGAYPTTTTYPQAYAQTRIPGPVPSRPHNTMDFEHYASGTSNSSAHHPPRQAPHGFPAPNGIGYDMSMLQPADYEASMATIPHAAVSAPQDPRYGRSSADAGPPNGHNVTVPPQPQPHAFHSQAQVAQHMQAANQPRQTWSDDAVFTPWNQTQFGFQ